MLTNVEQRTESNVSTVNIFGRLAGLTEIKRATKDDDARNHIAEHHQLTKHKFDWDSAECITYSTNYQRRLTLESWCTNLEQEPLNRCQQLPALYE